MYSPLLWSDLLYGAYRLGSQTPIPRRFDLSDKALVVPVQDLDAMAQLQGG